MPLFKEHGYRKTGCHFARRHGTVGHYLNIQLSQWNQGAHGHFFVNAGVMFDDFKRLRGTEPPALPKYGDCDFMVRLDAIDSTFPRWVDIDDSTNVEEKAAWLNEHIEKSFVVPLDAVSSTQAFAKTGWVNAIPWDFPAVFQYLLGEIEESRRLVGVQAERFADRGCTFEALAESLHLRFKPA